MFTPTVDESALQTQ